MKGSQKEMTGRLYVTSVDSGPIGPSSPTGPIYTIGVDLDTIEHGQEEDVDVRPTRYSFHSHPLEAYIRHGVKKAWPSSTDFLGMHKLWNSTIFHCVATLEGVYIVSFAPYWCNRMDKVSKSFIQKHFDIDHKEKYTPEQFVEKVNSTLYKGYPVFHVYFRSWKKGAAEPFTVFYRQIGKKCEDGVMD